MSLRGRTSMVVAVGVVMALGQGVTAGGASAAANVMVVPVSGTAVGAPSAPTGVSAFPVRGGVGVAWAQPEAFLPDGLPRLPPGRGRRGLTSRARCRRTPARSGDTTRAPGQTSPTGSWARTSTVPARPVPRSPAPGSRRSRAWEPSTASTWTAGSRASRPTRWAATSSPTTGLTQGDPVDVFPNRVQRYLQAANVSAAAPRPAGTGHLPGPSGTGGTRPGVQVSSLRRPSAA